MKKKVLAAILLAVGVLTGCGNSEPISSPIQTVEAEPIATDTKEVEQPAATESSADEVAPEHSYRSELTNEWIDEDLKDQRPIAVMVDNERTALPHFGVADADVVYEIMNSTLNDRALSLCQSIRSHVAISRRILHWHTCCEHRKGCFQHHTAFLV